MSTSAARRPQPLPGTTMACARHHTRLGMLPPKLLNLASSNPSRALVARSAAPILAVLGGPLLVLSALPPRVPTATDMCTPTPSHTPAEHRSPRCSITAPWRPAAQRVQNRATPRSMLRAVRESSGRMLSSGGFLQTIPIGRVKRRPTRGCLKKRNDNQPEIRRRNEVLPGNELPLLPSQNLFSNNGDLIS